MSTAEVATARAPLHETAAEQRTSAHAFLQEASRLAGERAATLAARTWLFCLLRCELVVNLNDPRHSNDEYFLFFWSYSDAAFTAIRVDRSANTLAYVANFDYGRYTRTHPSKDGVETLRIYKSRDLASLLPPRDLKALLLKKMRYSVLKGKTTCVDITVSPRLPPRGPAAMTRSSDARAERRLAALRPEPCRERDRRPVRRGRAPHLVFRGSEQQLAARASLLDGEAAADLLELRCCTDRGAVSVYAGAMSRLRFIDTLAVPAEPRLGRQSTLAHSQYDK
jgi:hypothetical protein